MLICFAMDPFARAESVSVSEAVRSGVPDYIRPPVPGIRYQALHRYFVSVMGTLLCIGTNSRWLCRPRALPEVECTQLRPCSHGSTAVNAPGADVFGATSSTIKLMWAGIRVDSSRRTLPPPPQHVQYMLESVLALTHVC